VPTTDLTPDHAPAVPVRGRRVTRALAAVAAVALLGGTVAACAPGAAPVAEPAPPVTAPAAPGAPDGSGAPALERADVDAWLDGLLPAALDRTRIAGAAVSVVHDGELVTARGYGWADTGADGGDPVPVDPEATLFRPGSVSKLVTATAVMQLVEAGDVDLDAPVADYLDVEVPTTFDEPITLRHLLTHTAGFEERVAGLIGVEGDPVDLRAALSTDAPEQVYRPGTVPAYSNYGNALAGYVVEHVSGERFEDYVAEHVLEPAGMSTATFEQPLPDALRDRMSRGYATADSPASPFEVVGVAPAGALSASATDMAGFMLAQLGEPTGEPLLDPETLDLMHAPALDADTLGTLADGPRMTLGFFDESRNGHDIVGHGGDTNVFHSHLQLYPQERTGIFVSFNSSGEGAADTVELRDQLMHGFADRYFPADDPAAAPVPTVDADTAREHAAQAAGSYTGSRNMHSTFLAVLDVLQHTEVTAQDDGRILLTPGPGSTRPVLFEEVEPWVWQEVGGQQRIAARAADGQVEAISWQSAFTLLRSEPANAVAVPVLVASVAVLLVTAVAWLVAAVVRRVRRRPAPLREGRVLRVLTRVAAGAAVVALAGWFLVIQTVMGLQEVPAGPIRGLQVLQGLAVVGLVPAVLRLVGDVRARSGWRRVLASGLVLAALAGVAWFAVTYRLLAPSVSY
jgi:CubicO group peptidase (beta-lactamase class C family)